MVYNTSSFHIDNNKKYFVANKHDIETYRVANIYVTNIKPQYIRSVLWAWIYDKSKKNEYLSTNLRYLPKSHKTLIS